jgi:hypothetical protein
MLVRSYSRHISTTHIRCGSTINPEDLVSSIGPKSNELIPDRERTNRIGTERTKRAKFAKNFLLDRVTLF